MLILKQFGKHSLSTSNSFLLNDCWGCLESIVKHSESHLGRRLAFKGMLPSAHLPYLAQGARLLWWEVPPEIKPYWSTKSYLSLLKLMAKDNFSSKKFACFFLSLIKIVKTFWKCWYPYHQKPAWKKLKIWPHLKRVVSWYMKFKKIIWRKEHCNFSISDRLCFAILYSRPKSSSSVHYFSIDNELEYEK